MLLSPFIPCLMTISWHWLFPKDPVPTPYTPTFTPIYCTFTPVCSQPLLNCNPSLSILHVICVCYHVQIHHLHHAEEKEVMLCCPQSQEFCSVICVFLLERASRVSSTDWVLFASHISSNLNPIKMATNLIIITVPSAAPSTPNNHSLGIIIWCMPMVKDLPQCSEVK